MTQTNQTTALLVPMALRAMLVNQPVRNGTTFRRWQNNYNYVVNNMDSAAPAPFQDPGAAPQDGVHLHWKLPQAFKHGRPGTRLFTITANVAGIVAALGRNQVGPDLAAAFAANQLPLSATGVGVGPGGDGSAWQLADWPHGRHYEVASVPAAANGAPSLVVSDARVSFPEVPNRWLVVRFVHGAAPSVPVAWIVESDYMNAVDGAASFLDPASDGLASPHAVTRIGRAQVLTASWAEDAATGAMYLRAVGPGDVTFAAYAPAAPNVFSFIDTGAAALLDNTGLAYLVAGWYANPLYDPLSDAGADLAGFIARMESNAWTLAGVPDLSSYTGPLANQAIVHGMVHTLAWQTTAMPSGAATQVPTDIGSSVKVAIGNTSVEALSALVGATAGGQDIDLALLEALQYGGLDALDAVGGRAQVADQARQARYAASPAGQAWEIRARATDGAAPPAAAAPALAAHAAQLAALNTAQAALDANVRTLASLQWTLYARWWKNQNYNVLGLGPANPPPDMDQIAAALDPAAPEYKQLLGDMAAVQQQIAAAYAGNGVPASLDPGVVEAYARTVLALPPELVLQPRSAPRYWHPNDPVLLVAGIANPDDATSTAALSCRTLAQAVTGLVVNDKTVTAAGAGAALPLPVANPAIPAAVYALCQEAFWFDPGNWDAIARNLLMGAAQAADIGAAIGKAAWSDPAACAPLPLAMAAWAQPWDPLFLEWRIKWFPTYARQDASAPWQFKRAEWQFNGDDYTWTGLALDASLVTGYSGRTVLSPHAVFNFENRLRDLIARSPTPQGQLTQLDTLVQAVRAWGVSSQRLSGLHDAFVTRSARQAWPPQGAAAALVQNQYQSAPDPGRGDKDDDYGPPMPSFFPQMGGFFVIDDIDVVDSFGQCISLLPANQNPTGGKASGFTPIRSRQLTPANPNIAVGDYTPAQFVQQAFALVQPAQLALRWVDAASDARQVGLAAGANPVCGWVLPNHLDNALAFYDQQGLLLGEVRADMRQNTLAWFPAPDSAAPVTTPDLIGNTHLRSVVTGLMTAQQQSPAAFGNLVQAIDESLWLVDPLGGRADLDLAVLIGRPLAVLRLKVALECEGDLFTNQSWAGTFKADDNGVAGTAFSLRLGSAVQREDGLIGYYTDAGCLSFNAVHVPASLDASSGYVKPIGGADGNYLSVTPDGSASFVTLLMDPRGSLHGATGILPVKEIALPNHFVDAALGKMEVTFNVGSLLTSAAAIQVPRLAEQNGTWSWIRHTSAAGFDAGPVDFSTPNANLSAPSMVIQDGWLKFVSDLNKESGHE